MEGRACELGESSKNYYQELQHSAYPNVKNVVSGFNVGCALDSTEIALKARNAEYRPRRFNAVIMRIREPKSIALIFPSGKIIVTGAKSEDSSRLACRRFARIIQKLGYPAEFLDWKVLNMVALVKLPFTLNLVMLDSHTIGSFWEPEIFPALVYKMLEPKMTLLVFSSGKVVLLGFKEKRDMDTAYQKIIPVLIQFKKDA